jgi:hypothetical protein
VAHYDRPGAAAAARQTTIVTPGQAAGLGLDAYCARGKAAAAPKMLYNWAMNNL